MNLVRLRKIQKRYAARKGDGEAIKVDEMTIPKGDFAVIAGPSGCGKSTLLNIMGLLDRPDAGQVEIDGRDMAQAGEGERSLTRNRKIGFVFQHFNLLPDLTAEKNVALPLVAAGVPRAERTRRAADVLERVGLGPKGDRLPSKLSGGEQQRVAIARALVGEPPLLLADEPTGNLDRANTQVVMDIIRRLHSEGMTVVLVTHDPDVASQGRRVLHPFARK